MPFYIMSTYRTGSTFLAGCLNSHPNVICESEILNRSSWKKPFPPPDTHKLALIMALEIHEELPRNEYLTGMKNETQKQGPCKFGAMIKYQHLDNSIVERLNKMGARLIFITRNDVVNRELSYIIAQEIRRRSDLTERIHYSEDTQVKQIYFNEKLINLLIRRVENSRNIDAKYMSKFNPENMLVLNYEALTDNKSIGGLNASISRDLCEFIGVETMPLSTNTIKNKAAQPENIISNYTEVMEAYNGRS